LKQTFPRGWIGFLAVFHVITQWRHAAHPHALFLGGGDLVADASGLLKTQGDLAGARPLLERALAIYEKALGAEHPDTATSLNNLAGLLKTQGDLAGARPLYERALAIYEKALGAEHPATATVRNNLASLLSQAW
jgi:tetratricopeptide (TPR) repeat protein